MTDANGKLEHRTEQAFARMHKRMQAVENNSVTRQQLEDLVQLVPKLDDLIKRVTRIENAMVHWQDQREVLHSNANLMASECLFIRERLITLEGRMARAGSTETKAEEVEEAEVGS